MIYFNLPLLTIAITSLIEIMYYRYKIENLDLSRVSKQLANTNYAAIHDHALLKLVISVIGMFVVFIIAGMMSLDYSKINQI